MLVTKGPGNSGYLYPDPTNNRLSTESGYQWDNNGNMAVAPFQTYTYDVENRLVQSVHTCR